MKAPSDKTSAFFRTLSAPLWISERESNTAKTYSGRKIPILLNSGGGDSAQEEIYFVNPAIGPEVGYAVITFEGPGQGIVLRRDKVPMRPDREVVSVAVLDHLFDFAGSHPELELDLDHIAMTGASMGGYFALRMAVDPRIKACVSVDGFYSLASFVGGRMPWPLFKGFMNGWLSDAAIDMGLWDAWTASGEGEKDVEELATMTTKDVEPELLRHQLRLMAANHIVEETEQDRYAPTPFSLSMGDRGTLVAPAL
ncbi:MAG: hypothetical protein Q9209_001261 [Squamulea sp. 1 TL-2023]